jgi:myo-inositol-1(or 4)-monophosphatase
MNKNMKWSKEQRLYLQFGKESVWKAGKILMSYRPKRPHLKIIDKKDQGVTSEADLASEAYLKKRLHQTFSTHHILAEETSFMEKISLSSLKNSDHLWIIDPLDGTNNYLSGFDHFCVCLGYRRHGKMLMGLVYKPVTGDLYWAYEGMGAYKSFLSVQGSFRELKKSRLLRGHDSLPLEQSLVLMSSFQKKKKRSEQEQRFCDYVVQKARGTRKLGSAALEMCLVAEGIFGGMWERGLSPWDIAASGLICSEAGASLTGWRLSPFDLFDEDVMVFSPGLQGQMNDYFRSEKSR